MSRPSDPLTAAARALPLALLLITACTGEPPAEQQLAEASRSVTLGTLADIGPHRLESTIVHEQLAIDRSSTQTLEVSWGDWDNFQVRRIRDGRLRAGVLVVDGLAWSQGTNGKLTKKGDAEIYRGELAGSWDTWRQALEPFAGRVNLVELESTVVEGRPATRYQVTLGPEPEGTGRRQHQPVSLEGEVVLDKATAARLLAQVEGRYLENSNEDLVRVVRLQLTRSNLGVVPELEAPTRKRGKRGKRPGGADAQQQ